MTATPVVEAKNLRRIFDVSKPWLNRVLEGGHLEFLKAVDGVSFDIFKGETFALVGESGSGKTTVARMIVGLLPPTSGEVIIDGVSMSDPAQAQARQQLRRRIQMIFQDPYASLNPRLRVDAIVAEPIRAFNLIEGERHIKDRGAAVMLITHDMGVIAETCDRVAVMYAGRIAEIGPVHQVINQPAHPYTMGLMAAIPDITVDRERLHQIDGTMPRLNAIPPGCAYNPRCPRVFGRCRVERPDLLDAGATRAACWLHDATAGVTA